MKNRFLGSPGSGVLTNAGRQQQQRLSNTILAPSDYYDYDVIVGKPLTDSSIISSDQLQIRNNECYYGSIYIAPAQLCLQFQGKYKTKAIPQSTTQKTPETVTEKLSSSVWETLKSLPILGQLLEQE